MATVTKPIALDESLHTTEQTPRNLADVLAQALQMLNTTISGLNFINCVVVQTLPTTDISTTTIYLVPKNPSQTDNLYDEYINLTGTSAGWEKIGDTEIDLSGYYTSAEVDNLLADKADVSDIPTVNDGTLTIQQNGETKGTFTANQSGNSTVNIETPTTNIQTAVDEFETYNGGLLSECKVALSPNQDLHGYDEPWVGGSRKNKVPLRNKSGGGLTFVADELLGKMTMTGTATIGGWAPGIMIEINLPAGSYICSATNNPNNANIMTEWQPLGAITSSGITFNVTSNTQPVRVAWRVDNGTTYNNVIEGLMIRSASDTDPTFEPYSNICPITGHTEVDVDVSDGQTTQEQITVNLGGTYYSGILDVVSGVFVADKVGVDLGTLTYSYDSGKKRFLNSLSGVKLTDDFDITTAITSVYKAVSLSVLYADVDLNGVFAISSNGNLSIRDLAYTDVNTFQSAMSGQTLVYPLATPLTIQLSPTMVKALVGENHLSAPLEGQEITEVKYKKMFTFDDVIAYIQSLS